MNPDQLAYIKKKTNTKCKLLYFYCWSNGSYLQERSKFNALIFCWEKKNLNTQD